MTRFSAVVVVLLISGCTNLYSSRYEGMPDARVRPGYIASTEALKIYDTDDIERDGKALMQRGYVPIGQSSFNASIGRVSEGQLREHAQTIGAHVVLFTLNNMQTITDVTPLTLPTVTTSYTTGTATAYGKGGPVTAFGSGTTTTLGTQTTYFQSRYERADHSAVFFVKARTRIGFYAKPLDDDTRRRLERNTGVLVGVVVNGSPAFDADILSGDVLISFGGQTVRSVEHYQDLLVGFSGESVELVLSRNGRTLTKVIPVRSL